MRKYIDLKNCKEIKIMGRRQLCKLAVLLAPLSSKFCVALYYQTKEPDNMKEFVANRKNILEGMKNDEIKE